MAQAEHLEESSSLASRIQEELAEVWSLLRGFEGRTLDVACGTGFITQHLSGEVVGLDQSEAMLAIARERVAAP